MREQRRSKTGQCISEVAPQKVQRALDLAAEKGSSVWLTVLAIREMGFNLNETEFRDVIKLRYDWPVDDTVYPLHLCMRRYFHSRPRNDMQARWVRYPTSQ